MSARRLVVLLVVLSATCRDSQTATTRSSAPSPPPPAQEWFVDRAAQVGLDFVHVNGMSGRLYMVEILAPGVALFDYDNDGDLDVYLVQGTGLERRPPGLNDRLYRNDVRINADGTRVLRFTDVTRESRIEARGYGMGVAAGDFNNDGWVDL